MRPAPCVRFTNAARNPIRPREGASKDRRCRPSAAAAGSISFSMPCTSSSTPQLAPHRALLLLQHLSRPGSDCMPQALPATCSRCWQGWSAQGPAFRIWPFTAGAVKLAAHGTPASVHARAGQQGRRPTQRTLRADMASMSGPVYWSSTSHTISSSGSCLFRHNQSVRSRLAGCVLP